jgi:hypothetical protein
MKNGTITYEEWMRQWLAMLDRRQPGWRSEYDREAFELAVRDLFGGQKAQVVGEEGLDLLGDFTMNHDRETAALAAQGLEESPAFRRAMIEFEYIFRTSHGSSRGSSDLREMRRRTMKKVVDAVLEPMLRRFGQMAHAKDMKRRRRSRRSPRLPEPGLLRDARGRAPEVEAQGREAAERVLRRAKKELAPGSVKALRRFFSDKQGRPAGEVAKRAGISPATMTRALQKLQAIAAEELEGCPDAVLRPFTEALLERIGAA